MKVTLKYIGATNVNFTKDRSYVVVGFVGACGAVFVGDKSSLAVDSSIIDQARWQLISVGEPTKTAPAK